MPTEYALRLDEARREAVAADPLINGDGVDATYLAMLELAKEIASLKWERERLELQGRDPSQTCSRIVSGLAVLGSLVSERHRHQPPDLEVRGPKMQRVVADFLAMFERAARESLPPEDAATFIEAFRGRMRGWEEFVGTGPENLHHDKRNSGAPIMSEPPRGGVKSRRA